MNEGINLSLKQLVRLRASARGLQPGYRGKAMSAGAGGYLSAFRGRGMEFDEVRTYQYGDDVRSIDWRVTARRGEPYTKLFREERERPVFILADLHPGMFFGTRRMFKSVLAMQLSAIVAWAAEISGDRVGGVIGGNDSHTEIAPRPRSAGVLGLLHGLDQLQPRQPGELQTGRLDSLLEKLARITHPGSLVLIFSDFQEMSDLAERHLTTLKRHNDVRIGFISDPLEATPPPKGRYQLGTPDHQIRIDARNPAIRNSWRIQFQRRYDHVSDICRRNAIPLTQFDTGTDPLKILRGFI